MKYKNIFFFFITVCALHLSVMNAYLLPINDEVYARIYYFGDALIHLLEITTGYLLARELHKDNNTKYTALLEISLLEWIFIAGYNLTDELFEKYAGFHYMEYICFFLCVFSALWKFRKWRIKQLAYPRNSL